LNFVASLFFIARSSRLLSSSASSSVKLSDINSLIRGVEQIYSNVGIDSGSFTVGMGKPDRQVLFVSSDGQVEFKDANDTKLLLINRVSETAPTLTPERQSKVTAKLLEAVLLISNGEDPKDDMLIHISQMSDKRIAHPLEVLSINQQLTRIRVLEVDKEHGKVSLSLKEI
jgi:hypothetical protein